MARHHGKKGVLYLSATGTGVAVPFTIESFEFSAKRDRADVTSMGDLNKRTVQGLPEVSGSVTAFYDDSASGLFSASESSDGCRMYLYPTSDVPGAYHYGPAWLDYTLTSSANGTVKLVGNFSANGDWGRKP